MKKLFLLGAALSAVTFLAQSQTIEDAKKQLYYEKYESAKNSLQSVIAKPGALPEAWYLLGNIYLDQNKIDSADAVIQAGMNHFKQEDLSVKKYPLLPIGQARLLMEKGNVPEARKQIEAVLTETKYKNADALWAAAKANIDTKNGDSLWAITLLEKAISRDKKNPAIYVTLGDAYRKMIDGSNAVINYDKALAADRDYAEAIHKKARIYKTQKNPDIYLPLFTQAIEADSNYAPSLYELYYHYYFTDVKKAAGYLNAYIRHADPSPEHAYMLADLHYVSKQYELAISEAKNIIQREGDSVAPRMYKLMAYSNAALGDSSTALTNMNIYFEKQEDTGFVAKDYAMKAHLLKTLRDDKNEPIQYFIKAVEMEKDPTEKLDYVVSLADLQNSLGNRAEEAVWREQVYRLKEPPTNLDIYKWGMALYYSKNYVGADTVFGIYQEKYPDQVHGHLWRARSNALMDTTMQLGLAVPHYTQLVELVSKDTVTNKALLVTAYEYLGAYEANTTKDFTASLGYYDKILQLEPEHTDAKKYAGILEKWIADGKGKDAEKDNNMGETDEEKKQGDSKERVETNDNKETKTGDTNAKTNPSRTK